MADVADEVERKAFTIYFFAQSAVGIMFWAAVFGSRVGRKLFDLMPGHPSVTDAFFAADLLAVASSLASAVLIWRRSTWAFPLVAFTAGCLVYPTLYLTMWAPSSAGAARCLAIMLPPACLGVWITVRVRRGEMPARRER